MKRKQTEKEIGSPKTEFKNNNDQNSLLELSEKRLKESQKAAQLGYWELDHTQTSSNWSEGINEIFDLKNTNSIPSKLKWSKPEALWKCVHTDDIKSIKQTYLDSIDNKTNYDVVYRLVITNSKIKHIREIVNHEFNTKGSLERSIGIVQDITIIKEQENELIKKTEELELAKESTERAIKEAELAKKVQGIFLSNTGHQLRTPLNTIIGFSKIIQDYEDLPISLVDKISMVRQSGQDLLGMINDILDLSKIEAGELNSKIETFYIYPFLKEMIQKFSNDAKEANLALKLHLDPGLQETISADKDKLNQILTNLLSNAIIYTPSGSVELFAQTYPDKMNSKQLLLEIRVKDTGEGIPEDYIEGIFKSFYQPNSSGAGSQGVGLGLAIVKSFVRFMKGTVEVKSSLGEGSEFKVVIPVPKKENADSLKNGMRNKALKLKPKNNDYKMLIVEDNYANRLLLSTILTEAGFEVKEAINGKEAVEKFKSWKPQLIWMDCRMPVMDGYEATRLIRESEGGGEVIIIAITANVFEHSKENVMESGCNDVVHKPFLKDDILNSIKENTDLEFIYEENPIETIVEQKKLNGVSKEFKQKISSIPKELLIKIRKAVVELNIEESQALINDIKEMDPEMGAILDKSLENFDFQTLQKLIIHD